MTFSVIGVCVHTRAERERSATHIKRNLSPCIFSMITSRAVTTLQAALRPAGYLCRAQLRREQCHHHHSPTAASSYRYFPRREPQGAAGCRALQGQRGGRGLPTSRGRHTPCLAALPAKVTRGPPPHGTVTGGHRQTPQTGDTAVSERHRRLPGCGRLRAAPRRRLRAPRSDSTTWGIPSDTPGTPRPPPSPSQPTDTPPPPPCAAGRGRSDPAHSRACGAAPPPQWRQEEAALASRGGRTLFPRAPWAERVPPSCFRSTGRRPPGQRYRGAAAAAGGEGRGGGTIRPPPRPAPGMPSRRRHPPRLPGRRLPVAGRRGAVPGTGRAGRLSLTACVFSPQGPRRRPSVARQAGPGGARGSAGLPPRRRWGRRGGLHSAAVGGAGRAAGRYGAGAGSGGVVRESPGRCARVAAAELRLRAEGLRAEGLGPSRPAWARAGGPGAASACAAVGGARCRRGSHVVFWLAGCR